MSRLNVPTPIGPWRFLTPLETSRKGDAARFLTRYPAEQVWEYIPENKWSHTLGDDGIGRDIERIRPMDETAQLVVTTVDVSEKGVFAAAEEIDSVKDAMYHYDTFTPGDIIPRPE